MRLITKLASVFFDRRLKQIDEFCKHPAEKQQAMFQYLMQNAEHTAIGQQYNLNKNTDRTRFCELLPVHTYEDLKPYIDRCRQGEANILWEGKINWYAKSSGTAEDKSKFIPVTDEALKKCHFQGGLDVLAIYQRNIPNTKIFEGRTLTLGGCHEIDSMSDGSAHYGDLSAILLQRAPSWVSLLRSPNKDEALIANLDEKIEKIVQRSMTQNIVAFAGVPSWNLVLMRRVLEASGKNNLHELWPNMELFMHGGVAFTPYREVYKQLFPSDNMHYMETYNASEGFFALQDDLSRDDMLLMLDYGVYFEFLPLSELNNPHPHTLSIEEVELGKSYALILNSSTGLWRYLIGDTITFTSLYPHRIKITGRTKHFINAFGEEIIVDNAEKALKAACKATNAVVLEYMAGPVYMTQSKKGTHEWLIEFDTPPQDLELFKTTLDTALRSLNSDYDAKRTNNVTMRMPLLHSLPKGTFYNWMATRGKLGGQNKIPRLCNDRKFLDQILQSLK